ncbi:adenylate kinase [Streptomyces sp. ML-6]|uniref:adenylate kinase n=1 Tax=Streptomyces sp. ML-6 TaxID=2982693 RepID=UPI0024BF6497|nr:adenylate kinase [Streptomyces sp. ML-6]MDK0517493.1 adenylate kinase [Streptomyces sp. ML-6]MDK0524003.1 adenylate kinase [Streptomyces sp. ML-6]MDK0524777.1 adenylate kinase [Streptomyces sp. ML-6]MDK0524883.1 adenylate kinase [Streptomyces sp. ML-6]
MKKIALFGPPASGKTTIAKELSASLEIPCTDLDNVLFTENGPLPLDEFRGKAERITRGESWVVEGNYSKLADVVWHRADVLVWLDLPLPLIVRRIVYRSLRQLTGLDASIQAQRLTWKRAFFGRRSLLRTAVRKYRNNRPRYARQVAETAELGVRVVRLRSGREADAWLARQLSGR